ncbi:aldehyde-activating protein [Kaistia algarum]|uniref:GFA family protein n=1 Tax=Kaistia algarum TaxID=2083279 RepID=UPI000CE7A71F|nr:GFA family protein [Kaistia algarum]MCX5512658.1 GFA family protein [Kaistia algarum]PPE81830.1 aldehyde-activating protein [Kaistia algarum]
MPDASEGGTEAGPRRLAGSCLCGTVRYEVPDAFLYALNCHCGKCRRTTGAAFKPIAAIEAGRLRVTAGADDLLLHGSADAHDAHCRRCGSFLYSLVRDAAFIHVGMGTLLDTPSIRPSVHIFVGSKAPWYTINDDLPQYEGHVVKAGD